jgi:hypothetical protein
MAFAFSVHPKPPRLEDGKGKAKAENPTAGRIWLWIESPPKTWIAGAQRRQSQGLRMVREKQKPKIRPQEGFGFGLNLLPKPGSPERSDGNPKA